MRHHVTMPSSTSALRSAQTTSTLNKSKAGPPRWHAQSRLECHRFSRDGGTPLAITGAMLGLVAFTVFWDGQTGLLFDEGGQPSRVRVFGRCAACTTA